MCPTRFGKSKKSNCHTKLTINFHAWLNLRVLRNDLAFIVRITSAHVRYKCICISAYCWFWTQRIKSQFGFHYCSAFSWPVAVHGLQETCAIDAEAVVTLNCNWITECTANQYLSLKVRLGLCSFEGHGKSNLGSKYNSQFAHILLRLSLFLQYGESFWWGFSDLFRLHVVASKTDGLK